MPRRALRLPGIVFASALWMLRTSAAAAADCTPPTGHSPCFDANTLWLRASGGRFLTFGGGVAEPLHALTTGVAASWIHRPVVLRAPSPDPEGRELPVLESVVGLSLLAAYTPLDRLEIHASLPTVIWQRGSGLEGVSSGEAVSPRRTTLRDPRVGAAYALLDQTGPSQWDIAARLETLIPLGDEGHFAGEAGPVVAPSISLETDQLPVFAGLEVGARFRETTSFGGARLGSQVVLAAGAGVQVLSDRALAAALELRALPTLPSQERVAPDGTLFDSSLVPAEWAVTVRALPFAAGPSFRLGAGGALPTTRRTARFTNGAESAEFTSGITAAAFRFTAVVAWQHEL